MYYLYLNNNSVMFLYFVKVFYNLKFVFIILLRAYTRILHLYILLFIDFENCNHLFSYYDTSEQFVGVE